MDSVESLPHSIDESCISAPIILPFPGAASDASCAKIDAPSRLPTIVDELEMRQDEVLQQLDDLDRRISALLDAYVQAREAS